LIIIIIIIGQFLLLWVDKGVIPHLLFLLLPLLLLLTCIRLTARVPVMSTSFHTTTSVPTATTALSPFIQLVVVVVEVVVVVVVVVGGGGEGGKDNDGRVRRD